MSPLATKPGKLVERRHADRVGRRRDDGLGTEQRGDVTSEVVGAGGVPAAQGDGVAPGFVDAHDGRIAFFVSRAAVRRHARRHRWRRTTRTRRRVVQLSRTVAARVAVRVLVRQPIGELRDPPR